MADLAVQVAPVDLVGAGGVAHRAPPGPAARCGRCRRRWRTAWRRAAAPCPAALLRAARRQPHVHVIGLVVGARQLPTVWPATRVRSALPSCGHAAGPGRRPHRAVPRHVQRRLVGLGAGIQVHQTGNAAHFVQRQARQPLQLGRVRALDRERDLLLAADRVEQADVGHGDAGYAGAGARAASARHLVDAPVRGPSRSTSRT